MSNSANLPAPYLGINDLIPVAALQSPECKDLLNFNVTEAGITLRKGDSIHNRITNTDQIYYLEMAKYTDSEVYLAIYNTTTGVYEFYDVNDGSLDHSSGAIAIPSEMSSFIFNKYLMFLVSGLGVPGYYYNGSTWGNLGYASATATIFRPIAGRGYKNRAYFVQSLDASYWYSDIDATSGNVTQVNLNGIVSTKCNLISIFPITIADTISSETYLSFIFNSGEVLFYSGSYPDSAEWRLVGGAVIGSPLNLKSVIDLQGDGLVMTDNGLYSLRDLFLKGSDSARKLSVNSKIQKKWTRLVSEYRELNSFGPNEIIREATGIWDKINDRIIISLPAYIDEDDDYQYESATLFIYDNILGAWFYHIPYGAITTTGSINQVLIRQIISYGDLVLMGCTPQYTISGSTNYKIAIYSKEGATDYQDVSSYTDTKVNYDYTMLSAPIPFPKTAVYEATQIEPIIESDLYAQTNWQFIADFGKQESGNQKTDALTTVSKPAVNVGMQNITYVQVKMSGATAASKTVGLKLYSYNVWYNSGEKGSR